MDGWPVNTGSVPGRPDIAPAATEIFDRQIAPSPWPSSRDALDVAVAALPDIADALTADVVNALALSIVDLREELGAVRMVLSSALAHSQEQHVEILRLQRRLADVLDASRAERKAAA